MARRLLAYGLAVALTGLATAVVLTLQAHLPRGFLSVFGIAVLFSAWFGGLGPGLLASLLSVAAIDYFVQTPTRNLEIGSPADGVQLLIFGCSAVLISILTQARAAARAQAGRATTRSKHDEALAELMRQGATERNTDRIIELVCQQAVSLTGSDYAGVRLLDETGHSSWAGMWGNRTEAWRRRRPGRRGGSANEALEAGHTIVSRLQPGSPPDPESVRGIEGGMVELATPLTHAGRSLGGLIVGWRSDVSPGPDQVRVAELLAGYAAAVLDNARSHTESTRRRAEAEALAELARQGAEAHKIESAVNLVCRAACELIHADFAALRMRAPTGQLSWIGVSGNRSSVWRGPQNPSGRGPAAMSMAEARTVVYRSGGVDADGDSDGLVILGAESAKTVMAVPLLRSGGAFGSLVISWRSNREVSTDDRRLGEALGGYVSAVLDNALAHAESEQQRAEAQALAELVRQGAEERDPEQATALICRQGCQILGADYAGLTLASGAGNRTWHGSHSVLEEPPAQTRGRPQGLSNRALESGHALVLDHIQEDPDVSQFHSREGGRTAVAAPCIGRSGLRAVLHFGWRRPISVTPAQLRLTEALASYATVILENASAHSALQERAETVRLANEQLRHVDEMKSNLISNVSHELRTPLSSIRAFSELLLDPDMDAETRFEFTHIINAESERLSRMVSNLLDLSRIQSHGVDWQFQPLDVRKELELAVAALRPAAEEKRLPLRLDVAPNVTTIVADRDGLQQALINLIANAVKFTDSGEVVVKAAADRGGVRLSVCDSGPGITPEEQERIFDRFYQAGNMLTSKPSGTGLGLAITKEILLQHGTDIELESAPRSGSRFSFVLPGEAAPEPVTT
jgi:signal transduction histidine kinase